MCRFVYIPVHLYLDKHRNVDCRLIVRDTSSDCCREIQHASGRKGGSGKTLAVSAREFEGAHGSASTASEANSDLDFSGNICN